MNVKLENATPDDVLRGLVIHARSVDESATCTIKAALNDVEQHLSGTIVLKGYVVMKE